jgi:deoxyribose-phosphate aldolase
MNDWRIASHADRLRLLTQAMDLTYLNRQDPFFNIEKFCAQAMTPLGCVAAVCVLPHFVAKAKRYLAQSGVQVATVVNFPKPHMDRAEVTSAIAQVVADGADEIDLVLPFESIMAGQYAQVLAWLTACREACGTKAMKVILETGALQQVDHIESAARCAIEAGADFLKTSSGVDYPGADVAVTKRLAKCIYDVGKPVGLKVSGGIKTVSDAIQLAEVVVSLWGPQAIDARCFRIGASSLRSQLVSAALIAE